jgi:RNA polymerase sigma-70 factor (ECF subfamily)
VDAQLPSAELSDEMLMTLVVQRNVAAFSQLFDRYAQTVYVLAAHMLGSTDAEEVVQEVFLRCWNKAEQFDAARGSFRSWFLTVARHYVLNELRRHTLHQRLQAVAEIDQLLASAADPAADVEAVAWQHVQQDDILRALTGLPDEQRQALVLAYFGGLSHTQIAQHLGWPLGTVKKRIQLGLQKLRTALAHHAPDTEAELGSKPPHGEYA